MKRFAILLAVSAGLIGCQESDPQPTATAKPAPAAPVVTAPVVPATPAPTAVAPAAERKLKGYFELKQDGKTYVTEDFASIGKVKAGDKTGTWAADWTDINGKTVALQDDGAGLAGALKKEYEKSHPKIEAK